MRRDYALLDINPIFPGLGEIIIIILLLLLLLLSLLLLCLLLLLLLLLLLNLCLPVNRSLG